MSRWLKEHLTRIEPRASRIRVRFVLTYGVMYGQTGSDWVKVSASERHAVDKDKGAKRESILIGLKEGGNETVKT